LKVKVELSCDPKESFDFSFLLVLNGFFIFLDDEEGVAKEDCKCKYLCFCGSPTWEGKGREGKIK